MYTYSNDVPLLESLLLEEPGHLAGFLPCLSSINNVLSKIKEKILFAN